MAAVAVYSEPDRLAPHVRDADAAMLLGPAPAAESHLDIKKLHAAAPLRDPVDARREAKRIGYPVLLKAVAGGGGKGMRLVGAESDVEGAFQAARREALKAFGDGSIYVEKYLQRPRHIEIQILADRHGRVIALGERECSIQRRHQKLIGESPSG